MDAFLFHLKFCTVDLYFNVIMHMYSSVTSYFSLNIFLRFLYVHEYEGSSLLFTIEYYFVV